VLIHGNWDAGHYLSVGLRSNKSYEDKCNFRHFGKTVTHLSDIPDEIKCIVYLIKHVVIQIVRYSPVFHLLSKGMNKNV
jgi:hypothetical protein